MNFCKNKIDGLIKIQYNRRMLGFGKIWKVLFIINFALRAGDDLEEITNKDPIVELKKYHCRPSKNSQNKRSLVVYPEPKNSKRYIKLTMQEFVRLKHIEELVLELNQKFYQAYAQIKKELDRVNKINKKMQKKQKEGD